MTEDESRPLLKFLYEHASRPDLTYRHRWSPGDVVMWDDRCTIHDAIHDHGEQERTLNRITIIGDTPA
jgi:alpha-ketoglutarate-dependent taurine dioxygenase